MDRGLILGEVDYNGVSLSSYSVVSKSMKFVLLLRAGTLEDVVCGLATAASSVSGSSASPV
jgi:hypothetical protein